MNKEVLENFDKARLLEIQTRFRIPEDDPIWLYLAALENYQRLFESVPLSIQRAATLEKERLEKEVDLISAKTADRITAVSESAAKTASAAADKAAAALVDKLDSALVARSKALAWRYRFLAFAGAFGLATGAFAISSLLSFPTPAWVLLSTSNSSAFTRFMALLWNAPAGGVVLLLILAAIVSYFFERAAAKVAADLYGKQI